MKFLSTVLLLASALTVRAALFTNSASADAFVRELAPTLNYGGAGALSVSGGSAVNGSGVTNGVFDCFLRFNTSAMVTNFDAVFGPGSWLINSAALRVTELGAPANTLFNRGVGAFEVRWIASDNWIEGTGTPNAPTTNGISYNDEAELLNGATDVTLGTFTNAGVDGTLSFALALPAPFIADLRAGGEVGLFMTAIEPLMGFTFDSRSFNTVAARPFLVVSAVPAPQIIGIQLSGADVVLSGTNGTAGQTLYVLTASDPRLPLQQWTSWATNVLTENGSFSITLTNAVDTQAPLQKFFTLRAQ